jgi:hypothetical protein
MKKIDARKVNSFFKIKKNARERKFNSIDLQNLIFSLLHFS